MRTKLIVGLTAFAAITAVIAVAVLFSIDSQKPVTDIPSQAAVSSGAEVSGQPVPVAALAKAHSPGGATTEGIAVHGHWTIEVRDPDGTLVTRREIESALESGGGAILSSYLARQKTVGLWVVRISAIATVNSFCLNASSSLASCNIEESASTSVKTETFKTLTVDAPISGTNAGSLVLTGTATAQADGEVSQVRTLRYSCAPTVAPASDCEGSIGALTVTTFTAIPVTTGQSILVTVVLSFS